MGLTIPVDGERAYYTRLGNDENGKKREYEQFYVDPTTGYDVVVWKLERDSLKEQDVNTEEEKASDAQEADVSSYFSCAG